ITIGEGSSNDATNSILIAFETAQGANAYGSVSIGGAGSAAYTISIGYSATANHSNSAAFGPPDHLGNPVVTTGTNQILLGTDNHSVSIPGILHTAGISNLQTIVNSTNVFRGDISFPRSTVNSISSASG